VETVNILQGTGTEPATEAFTRMSPYFFLLGNELRLDGDVVGKFAAAAALR